MKAIKFSIIYILSLFSLISCTKDFEGINTNPNAQVVGSNSGLLLGAQIAASRELVDNVRSFNKGIAKWDQYYNPTIDAEDFVPISPGEDFNDFWVYQNLVVRALPLVERILDNTEEKPHANYKAIALVLKAWIYENMTEFWGPIPFSDAQFGEVSEEERFNKPKYDTQEEVFKAVLLLLEEANNTFDLSGTQAVLVEDASDAFAGGDILKWKKFANSLRARILLRISDVDPAFAKTGLEAIFSNPTENPVIESNSDNMGMTWEEVIGDFTDPIFRYNEDNGFAPTVMTGFLNILGDREDPRMKVLVAPAIGYENADTYVGLPPAFDEDNPSDFTRIARDSVSAISENYINVQQRPIMTYAELLFIKAESELKNISVGTTAQTAYEAGITANMDELGVDSSDMAAYLGSALVVYDTGNAMEQIITQRYIAQFGQSANTFAMIRRTGFPELDFFEIGVNASLGYPVRMRYSSNHESFNKENFDAALAGVTIINSVFGDKLWFAQNATDVQMEPNLQVGPVLYSY